MLSIVKGSKQQNLKKKKIINEKLGVYNMKKRDAAISLLSTRSKIVPI